VQLTVDASATNSKNLELTEWLWACGGSVQHLAVCYEGESDYLCLQLPCLLLNRLETLEVHNCQVALHAAVLTRSTSSKAVSKARALNAGEQTCVSALDCSSSSSSPAGALLPNLKQLRFTGCDIAAASLRHFWGLPGLTSLSLQDVTQRDHFGRASQRMVSSLLQHSPGLLSLSLGYWESPALQVAALSRLQHLQSLSFSLPVSARAVTAAGHQLLLNLPTSLTALQLRSPGARAFESDDYDWRPRLSTAALTRLSTLQQLELYDLAVPDRLLAGLPGLQHLVLEHVSVHGTIAAADDTAGAFLGALAQLTQLRHLEVAACNLYPAVRRAPGSHLTALSASSQLTALHLRAVDGFPHNLLQYILPEGRQLQHLRSLQVAGLLDGHPVVDHDLLVTPGRDGITDADTSRLVDSCPNLQMLDVRHRVVAEGSLLLLAKLTAFHSLMLAGDTCDNWLAAEVAQLTGLHRLQWNYGTASIAQLQCLTALTNLQELQLGGWQLQGDWQQQGPNRVLAVCPELDQYGRLVWYESDGWDEPATLTAQVRSHKHTGCLHCEAPCPAVYHATPSCHSLPITHVSHEPACGLRQASNILL
jgi:hypothetical protein